MRPRVLLAGVACLVAVSCVRRGNRTSAPVAARTAETATPSGGGAASAAMPASGRPPPATAVTAEIVGGLVYVRAGINGSKPAWFVLDTGSSVTVVDTRAAAKLGLSAVAAGAAAGPGAGGSEKLSLANDVTIRLGGLRLEPQTVAVLPATYVEAQAGHATAGFVNPFRRHSVSIDYVQGEVRLAAAGSSAGPGAAELPLEFRNRVPYVRASLLLSNGRHVSGWFLVDTGLTRGIVLFKPFVDAHPELSAGARTIGAPDVSAVGGRIELRQGRLPAVQIASFVLEKPIIVFPQSARGVYADKKAAGSIGASLLGRFTVTFDYAGHRMFLEPNQRFSTPFEADASGVRLVVEPPDLHAFKVDQVMKGEPGAAAGLEPGDRILAVDGRPASELALYQLREMLRQPNRSYVLDVRRAERSLKLHLHTRALL